MAAKEEFVESTTIESQLLPTVHGIVDPGGCHTQLTQGIGMRTFANFDFFLNFRRTTQHHSLLGTVDFGGTLSGHHYSC